MGSVGNIHTASRTCCEESLVKQNLEQYELPVELSEY